MTYEVTNLDDGTDGLVLGPFTGVNMEVTDFYFRFGTRTGTPPEYKITLPLVSPETEAL